MKTKELAEKLEIDESLAALLQVGKKVRIDFGKKNPNNCVLHIRGIVDYQIISRFWVKHKKRWGYRMDDIYFLVLLFNEGQLKKA